MKGVGDQRAHKKYDGIVIGAKELHRWLSDLWKSWKNVGSLGARTVRLGWVSRVSNNATVNTLDSSAAVEFLGVLVNANGNGLCTTSAKLRCMDASVSALIFIEYL
ncbi:hypothetical protein FQA39_LY00203 [Lamprigera yunnana]|nr:hypothetical protein FQA39_LY00203 [Lamprigera yunnana]